MRRQSGKSGFFVIDAIIAIALLGAVATALTVACRSHANAMKRLYDGRAAARIAENVMTSMQTNGRAASGGASDAKIVVESLDEASPSNSEKWVRVRVDLRGHEAQLVGLVPRGVATEESR